MPDITDILADSAVTCAHSEMNLAIYLMRSSGIYEKPEETFDEGEWGLLTSTAALGYIYEFIQRRLSEEQRQNLFEPTFEKAAINYFAQTGASEPSELAMTCMQGLEREENHTLFTIGKLACSEGEGLFKHLLTNFMLKYGLLSP